MLHLDPPGELAALHRPYSWIWRGDPQDMDHEGEGGKWREEREDETGQDSIPALLYSPCSYFAACFWPSLNRLGK